MSQTEFYGPGAPPPHIPDDVSLVQFMFDYEHPTRPAIPNGLPWFIEQDTGEELCRDEVRITMLLDGYVEHS